MSSTVPSFNTNPCPGGSILPTSPTQNSKIIKPESQSEARRLEQENLATSGAIDPRKKEADSLIQDVITAAANPDVSRSALTEMIVAAVNSRIPLKEREEMGKKDVDLAMKLTLIPGLILKELELRGDSSRLNLDERSKGNETPGNSTDIMNLQDLTQMIRNSSNNLIESSRLVSQYLAHITSGFTQEIQEHLGKMTEEKLIEGYIKNIALQYNVQNPDVTQSVKENRIDNINRAAGELAKRLETLRYQRTKRF